MQLYCLQKII